MVNRRRFLKTSAWVGLGAAGLLSGCVSGKQALQLAEYNYQLYRKRSAFPKMKMSLDRVVKETVGLRPFRTHGPRVEKETLDRKTLVHNYGHGGSGWSLSWGTAHRAVTLAETSGAKAFAVLGCGVSGLTTATLLQERGFPVRIYTRDLPPRVTSSMATGTWSPSHYLIDNEYITDDFVAQWKDDAGYSFRRFQDLLGLNERVEWINAYMLSQAGGDGNPGGNNPFRLPGTLPAAELLEPADHPFSGWRVRKSPRLVFNIPRYLENMLDRFLNFGGQLEIREIKSLEDIDALPESCVMNCMGLGAKAVLNDEKLIPVSGQLAFLLPQPEINYCLMTPSAYSIPRKDGIVLGGDHIRGSWDTTPKREQTEKVVAALQDIISHMEW